KIVENRARGKEGESSSNESRRAALERQREAIQFDIDQGELALSPDNPWSHRIELLTEALSNVESELQSIRQVEEQPYHPLPSTPITDIAVSESEPYEVSFTIGDESFRWGEKLDW